jgi:hypothetical protein
MRELFLWAALAPLICAQTAAPIEVMGHVAQIDTQITGLKPGPGLFMTIRNVSGRSIQGFVYQTVFTDPSTGERLMCCSSHSEYKQPSLGVALAPGRSTDAPKPYHLPLTQSGSAAQYSFTVDLVVFDDGSTWGPGQLTASKQFLASHHIAK